MMRWPETPGTSKNTSRNGTDVVEKVDGFRQPAAYIDTDSPDIERVVAYYLLLLKAKSMAPPISAAAQNPRRFSLAHQASCETAHHADFKRQNTIRHRQQLEGALVKGKQILQRLNDEGIELIWAANSGRIEYSAVVGSSSACLSEFLSNVLKAFADAGMTVNHLETRPSKASDQTKENEAGWDVLADCESTKDELFAAAAQLSRSYPNLASFSLYKKDSKKEVPWFPRHVSELDRCSTCETKYEPTTDPRHPGHGDAAYIARRKFLNDQAIEFKHGDAIPYVEYTEAEHATWKAVYEKLKTLHESHTCDTYRQNFKKLENEGVLSPHRIPQIRDINKFLQKRTGFSLRPCSGLLSARDFLASLAFRVFQTTTYLRHGEHPQHSPEPDLIHELLGHVPMFSDPHIAQISQDIGIMSLGASDEEIEKLATVYWFIVEFGLCRENGELKAIGAGLLSAYGELMHACSDVPQHQDFDPVVTALQKYEDSDYQPLYFVANSIQDALHKLRQYALTMPRSYSLVYDPYTHSIETIRSSIDLQQAFERFQLEFASLSTAFERLNK